MNGGQAAPTPPTPLKPDAPARPPATGSSPVTPPRVISPTSSLHAGVGIAPPRDDGGPLASVPQSAPLPPLTASHLHASPSPPSPTSRSKLTNGSRTAPPSSTSEHVQPTNSPNVFSRLSALFHPEPQNQNHAPNQNSNSHVHSHSQVTPTPVAFPRTETDSDIDIDIDHIVFGDDDELPPNGNTQEQSRLQPPQPPQPPQPSQPDRNAIKVLVVTWNMGDALPKGDLSVLLGDVPAYEPTFARDAVEGLPILPIENAHPYHVVVFAAQECPTPSGVPRGLGGGLMKGVGLQRSEARRDKEKEGGKEPGKEGKEGQKDEKLDKKGSGDEKERPPPQSPKAEKQLKLEKDHPMSPIQSPGPGPASPAPTGTSTPRKTGLNMEKLGIDKLGIDKLGIDKLGIDKLGIDKLNLDGLGLSTPSRNSSLQSPTDEKSAPWDDERHHSLHGPALRPPAGYAPGPKGWSAMLEEWLCSGPRSQNTLLTPATGTTATPQSSTPVPTPQMTPKSSVNTAGNSAGSIISSPIDKPPVITMSPVDMTSTPPWMSMTAPSPTPPPVPTSSNPIPMPSKAIGIPPNKATGHAPHLAAPTPISYSRSPLSTSFEPTSVTSASTLATSVSTNHTAPPPLATSLSAPTPMSVPSRSLLTPPIPIGGSERDMNRSPSQRSDRSERLDIVIPERTRREPGTGPYINIAKERLLGLYLSVFVYRGCEHLVKGVDKDYVTTGLAGGRFGNKGGIGISLNLDNHRLLFVNSHLAAHAERNDARLANIAKIKAELNLNCFLEPDDPRAMLEDITDRFDTTFWCGDLNFRVDISLLHAKWLLEQKKYHEALSFDQLKKAMEDPKTNPLPGFEEAPITFMPTFKYDVWKSVRATNREIRRSLRRRRNTIDRPSIDTAHSPATALEFVPEGDGPEESGSDKDKAKSSCGEMEDEKTSEGDHRRNDRSTPSIQAPLESAGVERHEPTFPIPDGASARSGRSSMYADMSASFAHSFTTDTEPRMSGDFSRRLSLSSRSPLGTSANFGSEHLPKPKGLKEKTKKLLGILALGKRPPSRASSRTQATRDDSSRRMSMSSFRSVALSEVGSHMSTVSSEDPQSPTNEDGPGREKERTASGTSDRGGYKSDRSERSGHTHARRSSNASSKLLSSPPRRHLSILRRSGSGVSPTAAVVEEEYAFDLDDFDDTKDHRVGVYDTSKKQRVPSWCDRVLFKTHIRPDEDAVSDDDESSRFEAPSRFERLSLALSNFGDHFRRRSTVFEPSSAETHLTVPSRMPSRLEADGDNALSTSPRRISTDFTEKLRDSFQRHRTSLPGSGPGSGKKESGDDFQPRSLPSNGGDDSQPRSLRERSITFEGPQVVPRTPKESAPRRTSSADSTPSRVSNLPRRASVSSRRGSIGSYSSRRRMTDPETGVGPQMSSLTHIKSTGHSMGDTRRRSEAPQLTHCRSEDPTINSYRRRPSSGLPQSTQGMNLFTRFLRELPGRFHSRVSLFHGSDDENKGEKGTRHLAGEVQVLHYGTIDDAGMRQLEGRSDHRPAIFSAAIYV